MSAVLPSAGLCSSRVDAALRRLLSVTPGRCAGLRARRRRPSARRSIAIVGVPARGAASAEIGPRGAVEAERLADLEGGHRAVLDARPVQDCGDAQGSAGRL